jgi:hypothetical protein
MWGIGRGSGSGFFILLFVLTITFCLVSTGIFKANINIGMMAYHLSWKYAVSSTANPPASKILLPNTSS